MNQDQVKELLQKLRPTVADFTLVFTGKHSKKVNGLYKPENREILLHNRNFTSDAELLYTAIHEFAHHVHFTSDAPPPKARSHNKVFWALFHTLLSEAIDKGIYSPPSDPEIQDAIGRVRSSLAAESTAFKATGQALLSLVQVCSKFHVRFEDYLDREIGIKRRTAELAMAAYAQDVDTTGSPDQVKLLVRIKDPEVRRETILFAAEGHSLAQQEVSVEGTPLPSPRSSEPDPLRSTGAERRRLEAKLARLEEEAEAIRTRLNDMEPF